MSVPAVALLLTAALYTGFQWTIRVVVYPQFAGVGAAEFARYELAHQRRVSVAVGPLFAALAAATAAVLLRRPAGAPLWAVGGTALCLAAILGTTAFLAVPLHRVLSGGFDPAAHRRLLAVDTVRLVAAVADTALAAYLVLRSG